MLEDPQGTILALFATFCRIGGCFMVLPGFSSARVAMQIRIWMSIAVSMALLPLLWDTVYPQVKAGGSVYILLIGSETLIGVTIGLIARFIVVALQFAGTAISMAIGFNAAPMSGILENEPEGPITSLITFTAILVLVVTNFHHMVITSLLRSYEFMPMGANFQPRMALLTLTGTLGGAFELMLRLISPFVVYGLIFNFSIGMINRLAAQIPIYFISIPFILSGGLILIYFGFRPMITIFNAGFVPLFMGLP